MNDRFRASVDEFGIELRKTARIKHNGLKGTSREDALIEFLRDHLPTRFGVTSGEVVDLEGRTSQQLDIMIYDTYADFPFRSGTTSILAAEALLASVEVKSSLNAAEVTKCIDGAGKLRQLKPHGKELGGRNVGSSDDETKRARFMHCVFSYNTDIAPENWIRSEAKRFKAGMGVSHLIDAVYVLDRGLLNFNFNNGRLEDDKGGAISTLFFTILNFVIREADRRKKTPYDRYVTHSTQAWTKI